MQLVKARNTALPLAVLVALLLSNTALHGQSTGGRILGRVADPTGAVLAGVKVTLINQATAVQRTADTNGNGDYVFVEVAPGLYSVEFSQTGFKKNLRKGVSVDLNQVVTLNSTLELGAAQETVEVTSEAPLVDTTTTQLGAVVNNRSVNELPLNERDTYQFLQLQPGVQAQLGGSGGLFYGSDNAGSVSVNGGRTRANNFSVNGGDANDQFVNLPTVQPSPDSIEEFRVISNTFDAEYGRNSGAVVNVVTKSGTNAFHGNVYEYFRNKVLNAQGYLNTVKPQFNQNQFGGTFGGPIRKDRTFFFTSYEGRRIRQGQPSDPVLVPTADERNGLFAGGLGGGFDPNVYGFVGQVLDGRPGCDSALGISSVLALPTDPTTGLINWSTVFPASKIPTPCQDPVAADLMRFMPNANALNGTAYQAVPTGRDRQDQATIRVDHRINDQQNLTAYYYFTDGTRFQPFSFFQAAGANLPGFGSNVDERFQQVNLSHTWTITNAIVNEARITYMREGQLTFQHPEQTNLVTDSCSASSAQPVCFTGVSDSSAINALPGSGPKFGITPNLTANHEGVPFVSISGGGVFGNNFEGELPQAGNTYQVSDSVSWVRGNHTMKFGADVRYNQFNQTLYFAVNGDFTFNSTGANAVLYGDNYPGYLLGLPDQYLQGSAQVERVRSTGVYLFAQDSWKIKPNLTLNYGLRWELNTPLTDISQHIQTFRAGQTSTIYPCQLSTVSIQYFQSQYGVANPTCDNTGVNPTGLVVPGDKGIPAGLTSTYYKAWAPRIGLAYSPNFNDGFLRKVFGANGKTSIRTGWGLFYNPVEQLVLEQFSAEPPFGGSSLLFNTFFNTPFVNQGGFTSPNPFNGILNPPRGQPVDWSLFRPILLYGEFEPHLRAQYTAQYNFGIQRELSRDLVLQLNYVGSQGHRLLASHDIDPANPQTCLDIISIANAFPNNVTSYGSPGTCGQYLEDNQFSVTVPNGMTFHMPNGSTVTGTGQTLQFVGIRPYSSPNCDPFSGKGCPPDGTPVFTNIFAEDTVANSSYNSFQASLEKRFSHGLQLQGAYTWSKSLDQASSFEETLNPFNYRYSRALSLFNSAQRFVINYYWDLPIGKHQGFLGKVVDDWSVSGITQFQSGFPIRLQTQNDNELISSLFFIGTAAPQLTGSLQTLNPKNSSLHYYLNGNQFSDPALGTFATTARSVCCGPGLNSWDISFLKKIGVTESTYFQFRTDIFNLANHTQFYNPDGNFSDGPDFGRVKQAHDPRLVQFALKFYF
jgi:hypothetical protein